MKKKENREMVSVVRAVYPYQYWINTCERDKRTINYRKNYYHEVDPVKLIDLITSPSKRVTLDGNIMIANSPEDALAVDKALRDMYTNREKDCQ